MIFLVNEREIIELEKKFYKYQESDSDSHLDKTSFRTLFLANLQLEGVIIDDLFKAFDVDHDEKISLDEFIMGISKICHANVDSAILCMLGFISLISHFFSFI